MWFFGFVFFLPLTLFYLGLMVVAFLYLLLGIKQLATSGSRISGRTGLSAWAVFLGSLGAMGAFSWAYFRYIWFW